MRTRRTLSRLSVGAVFTAVALCVACVGVIPAASGAATGSVVSVLNGPFGPMLVAGSGQSAGTALYLISSDHGTTFGCTTTKQTAAGMPYVCTGAPSASSKAEWPAYTTTATPVAGTGVNKSMLGEVARPGIGEQVTYDGHPLYLFDSIPGIPTGMNWDEPSLPADHGVWSLVSPNGDSIGAEGVLTTVTVGSRTVLAAQLIDGGGVVDFPVYTYSSGTGCTGECAVDFPPLYAQGTPGLSTGLSQKAGLVTRADTSQQRTWAGKPLYLYGDEGLAPTATGVAVKGNGNGLKVSGGTFSLVSA
jgi:predicted lipoprotein with Yx(FWY)xxD motif